MKRSYPSGGRRIVKGIKRTGVYNIMLNERFYDTEHYLRFFRISASRVVRFRVFFFFILRRFSE